MSDATLLTFSLVTFAGYERKCGFYERFRQFYDHFFDSMSENHLSMSDSTVYTKKRQD